jgi:hypothetical protein
MAESKGSCRWFKGGGGQSFFISFLQRTILYAYGLQLAKRLAWQQSFDEWKLSIPACTVCRIVPTHIGICLWCTEEGQRKRFAFNGESPDFFAMLGHYLIALRYPQRWKQLVSLLSYQTTKTNVYQCVGCMTVGLPYDDDDGYARVVTCTSKQHNKMIYCGRAWCRPETLGKVRCIMCGLDFCEYCAEKCGICYKRMVCGDCELKYACVDCIDTETHRCPWHAPSRRPWITIYTCNQEPRLYLLCDEHWIRHDLGLDDDDDE